MSALTSIEAEIIDQAAAAGALLPGSRPAGRPLRLVRQPGAGDQGRRGRPGSAGHQPCSSSSRPAAESGASPVLTPSRVLPPRQVARPAGARAPIRLTARGRAVVAGLAVTVIASFALLIALAVAGSAKAASHGQVGGGYQGMHEVLVRPGQTLWSIASAAEPSADPRLVVQEIMSVNALTTTDISPGQVLWVPR